VPKYPFPRLSHSPTPLHTSELCVPDSEQSSETLVSIWPADLISFNSVMTCECLHCDHPSYSERYASAYRTSTATKVNVALGNARVSQSTQRSVQLYSVSTAALWAYDYLLTVGDEVGTTHYNDAEKKLTFLFRFITHGNRRTFSVRESSHVSRGDPNSQRFSVLPISIREYPDSRHHVCPDCHIDQIPSSTVPGVGEYQ